jgi:hypothetical protein
MSTQSQATQGNLPTIHLQELNKPRPNDVIEMVRLLRSVINAFRMYPKGNQMIQRSVERFAQGVERLRKALGQMVLRFSAEGIELNGEGIARAAQEARLAQELSRIFSARHIETLVIEPHTKIAQLAEWLGFIGRQDVEDEDPIFELPLQQQRFPSLKLNARVVSRQTSEQVRDKLSVREIVSSMDRDSLLKELGIDEDGFAPELFEAFEQPNEQGDGQALAEEAPSQQPQSEAEQELARLLSTGQFALLLLHYESRHAREQALRRSRQARDVQAPPSPTSAAMPQMRQPQLSDAFLSAGVSREPSQGRLEALSLQGQDAPSLSRQAASTAKPSSIESQGLSPSALSPQSPSAPLLSDPLGALTQGRGKREGLHTQGTPSIAAVQADALMGERGAFLGQDPPGAIGDLPPSLLAQAAQQGAKKLWLGQDAPRAGLSTQALPSVPDALDPALFLPDEVFGDIRDPFSGASPQEEAPQGLLDALSDALAARGDLFPQQEQPHLGIAPRESVALPSLTDLLDVTAASEELERQRLAKHLPSQEEAEIFAQMLSWQEQLTAATSFSDERLAMPSTLSQERLLTQAPPLHHAPPLPASAFSQERLFAISSQKSEALQDGEMFDVTASLDSLFEVSAIQTNQESLYAEQGNARALEVEEDLSYDDDDLGYSQSSLKSEVLTGEPLLGEVLTGEVLTGEVLTGEPLLGEVLTGEVLTGEVLFGDGQVGSSLSQKKNDEPPRKLSPQGVPRIPSLEGIDWQRAASLPVDRWPEGLRPEALASSEYLGELLKQPGFSSYLRASLEVSRQAKGGEIAPQEVVKPVMQLAIQKDLARFGQALAQIQEETLRQSFLGALTTQIADLDAPLVGQYWLQASPDEPLGHALRRGILEVSPPQKIQAVQRDLFQKLEYSPNQEVYDGALSLSRDIVDAQLQQAQWHPVREIVAYVEEQMQQEVTQRLRQGLQQILQHLKSKQRMTYVLREGMHPRNQEARVLLAELAPESLPLCARYLLKSPPGALRERQAEIFAQVAQQADPTRARIAFDAIFAYFAQSPPDDALRLLFCDIARRCAPDALEEEMGRQFARELSPSDAAFWCKQALLHPSPRLSAWLEQCLLQRAWSHHPTIEEMIFRAWLQMERIQGIDFLRREITDPQRTPAQRHHAIWMIGALPPEQASKLFEEMLFSPIGQTLGGMLRFQLTVTLWRRGQGSWRRQWTQRLLQDADPLVRLAAQSFLGTVAPRAASTPLGHLLPPDEILLAPVEILAPIPPFQQPPPVTSSSPLHPPKSPLQPAGKDPLASSSGTGSTTHARLSTLRVPDAHRLATAPPSASQPSPYAHLTRPIPPSSHKPPSSLSPLVVSFLVIAIILFGVIGLWWLTQS